jgi:hypothetical protein
LRSDPAFFDRQGALATSASGHYSFTGTNAFARAKILAIVVEVDPTALRPLPDSGADASVDAGAGGPSAAEAGPPILAVSGQTLRRGS